MYRVYICDTITYRTQPKKALLFFFDYYICFVDDSTRICGAYLTPREQDLEIVSPALMAVLQTMDERWEAQTDDAPIETNQQKTKKPNEWWREKENMQSFCRWVFTEIEWAHLYISPIENMKNIKKTTTTTTTTKVPFFFKKKVCVCVCQLCWRQGKEDEKLSVDI